MVTTCTTAAMVVFCVRLASQRTDSLERVCLESAAALLLSEVETDRNQAAVAPLPPDVISARVLHAVSGLPTAPVPAEGFASRLSTAIGHLLWVRVAPVAWSCTAPGTARAMAIELRPAALTVELRRFALSFWIGAASLSALVGGSAYLLLSFTLLRPMRRILRSMRRFRSDPEAATPFNPTANGVFADDEIAQAGYELAAMQAELRRALWRQARAAALGTAVAKMSHDLRGLLLPVMLIGEQMEASEDPQWQPPGERLVTIVERVDRLITETLSFASEAPRQPERSVLPVAEVVHECLTSLRDIEGVTYETRIGGDVVAVFDREHMLRVLSNLARNAVEAGARRIVIQSQSSVAEITLDVADDGPGLPPSIVERLFQPFATAGKQGGTGLGLAIVSDLMKAMHGSIRLHQTGPAGTIFRLILPRRDEFAEPA